MLLVGYHCCGTFFFQSYNLPLILSTNNTYNYQIINYSRPQIQKVEFNSHPTPSYWYGTSTVITISYSENWKELTLEVNK